MLVVVLWFFSVFSMVRMLVEAIRRLTAAGIDSARMEAQLLLAQVMHTTRAAIIAEIFPEPTAEERAEFTRLVSEREKRVPLAYLRGTQDFYGLTFRVSPAVLIPRPETELLVEFALSLLPTNDTPMIADVGTGSGCISIAILANCPAAQGIAFDISAKALATAYENAVTNGVTARLKFVQGDLLTAAGYGFDVVVSNPPYIPTYEIETLQPEVRDYEPRLALDGGDDGLTTFRRIIADAKRVLKPGGWLAMEAAQGQTAAVAQLLLEAGYNSVETRPDLAKIERIAIGRLP